MNELVGCHTMDKLTNRQTNGLNLTKSIQRPGAIEEIERPESLKWTEDGKEIGIDRSQSTSPVLSPNGGANYHNQEFPMSLPGMSGLPGCSSSNGGVGVGEEDEDTVNQLSCAWCQKTGPKVYSQRTSFGLKAFCSELCFAQCRRASFKKNKVCDWCKHIRHTVNYVEINNGKQSLQFCSDKCLNQYKMNIFCRETQAHLNAFSSIYRSSSSPTNHPVSNYRSNDLTENDKEDSKELDLTSNSIPENWRKSSNFHHIFNSTSSSQSSSSLPSSPRQSSSPPTTSSESLNCLPTSSSSTNFQQTSFNHLQSYNCPKEPHSHLTSDQFHVNRPINSSTPNRKRVKCKITARVKRPKSQCSQPEFKNLSRPSSQLTKLDRLDKLLNNRENISVPSPINLDEGSKDKSANSPAASNNESPPFAMRSALNPTTNQSTEGKRSYETLANYSSFHNLPTQCLPNAPMRIHHFPHPSQQYIHQLRPDLVRFRQSLPMFSFNQPNLHRIGHFRAPFPHVNHHFPCFPHFADHQLPHSSAPFQFQSAPIPGEPSTNNTFNYSNSLLSLPHPFLMPLPMPIPLPFPFPINLNPSANSVTSTMDKEVQVGFHQDLPSQFINNYQREMVKPSHVDLSKGHTKFRIDTLMNNLIDKRMRSMSDQNDQESVSSPINLKRTKVEQSTEPTNPKNSLIKAKRFKRDIETKQN